MSTDFLGMPDDELPEFAVAEQQMAEQEAARVAEEATQGADEVQQEVEQEQVTVDEAAEDAADKAEEQDKEDGKEDADKADTKEEQEEEEHNPLNDPDDAVKAPTDKVAGKKADAPAKKDEPEVVTDKAVSTTEEKPVKAETPQVDPAAFQSKILAPFKANGRDIQVKDADEAIRLMQMGANYNLKMAGLKPNLQMMRQLEDAGLLNPEAVANAIDLLKHKNPAAIARLAKDANVDPLDIKDEDVAAYAPKPAVVNEQVEALEGTLDEIQDRPSYNRVIATAKKMDDKSKELIGQHPHVLKAFEEHMTSGIYDVIDTEINRRKALGSIKSGTPFLEAYKLVGDDLQEQGAFAKFQAKATETPVKTPAVPAKQNVTAAPVKKNTAIDERRKAAAPTTSSPSKPTPAAINPLALSDADFEKLAQQNMQYSR